MKYIETDFKGELEKVWFEKLANKLWIHWRGRTFIYDISLFSSLHSSHLRKTENKAEKKKTTIWAPLSGRITKIFIKEGEEVKRGDSVVVMEAMKMEYHLEADKRGTVKKIQCQERQVVEANQALVIIEENKK